MTRGKATNNAQENAYRTFADAIMKGRYRPGTKVSMRALAGEIGTSVTPVREAVLKLEALGAVSDNGRGTLHIPIRAFGEVTQIYALRMSLEGQAAAEAASNISVADIARLKGIELETARMSQQGRLREVVALNEEFHFTIYRAAANRALMDVIELLWLRCGPLLPMVYGIRNVVQEIAKGDAGISTHHGAILKHLEQRDSESARQAMAEDVGSGLRSYTALTVGLEETIAQLSGHQGSSKSAQPPVSPSAMPRQRATARRECETQAASRSK